jgi:hypothetical protein
MPTPRPASSALAPGCVSSWEQPWRIVQNDPALFGNNLDYLGDADQQARPSEQARPHLQHLRFVRAFAITDRRNPPDASRRRLHKEALAATKPVPASVA